MSLERPAADARFPTNPQLEAAIRETKDDPGPYSVYADWLLSQGAPVGELIAIAREPARDPDRLAALEQQLELPSAQLATWTYRHGLWQSLRLENREDWMNDAFDAVALARMLFAHPLCVALDELRLGVLRWDHNHTDVPAVLAAAADHAWAGALSRLHLGDVHEVDMDHHVIGDVGAQISRSFPELRWLKLHSGAQEWRDSGETFRFADLDLPHLETLVIETCAMTGARLRDLWAAKLPALTHLDLWFGSPEASSDATVADLEPLLDGSLFGKLTHLGIKNQAFTLELVERLAASKLAHRLTTLDLSMSTIDDETATALAAMALAMPALRVLDVGDNFLTAAGLETLRTAFATAEVRSNGQDKLEYAEAGDRFVSVHE